jgi:hypothetical protein
MRYLIAALLIAVSVTTAQAEPLVDQLQDISVTIKSGRGQGSGVLFTRKVGDETVTYVWTAAHVVESQRKTRNVIVNGVQRTVVEFDDVQIVQEFKQDGRRIGEIKMEARVVRYSDADQGEDLALLEVRKRNFVSAEKTVKFYNGAIHRHRALSRWEPERPIWSQLAYIWHRVADWSRARTGR